MAHLAVQAIFVLNGVERAQAQFRLLGYTMPDLRTDRVYCDGRAKTGVSRSIKPPAGSEQKAESGVSATGSTKGVAVRFEKRLVVDPDNSCTQTTAGI